MNRMKATDILVCTLWWLTVSVVFPCQARKRGLIRRRWVRVLLTLLSPAAVLTYLAVFTGIILWDYCALEPGQSVYFTREEIVSLTGIRDFPDFVYEDSFRDGWEELPSIYRYAFVTPLPESARDYLESVCSDEDNFIWSFDVPHDIAFYGSRCYTYSHGWMAGFVGKPSRIIPDDMHVTLCIGEKGFELRYHSNELSFPGLKDWVKNASLSRNTGVRFPAFKVVDYELHRSSDPSVVITVRFRKKPGQGFFQDLKNAEGWSRENGFYQFRSPVDEHTRQAFSVRVFEDDRRLARIWCDTF